MPHAAAAVSMRRCGDGVTPTHAPYARRPEWIHHRYGQPTLQALPNLTRVQRAEITDAWGIMGDPRMNFDTFGSSLITLFIVSTGENWNDALSNTLATPYSVRWFAPLYVITWFLVSNYLLIQLFVAAILQQLDMAEADRVRVQDERFAKAWKKEAEKRRLLHAPLVLDD